MADWIDPQPVVVSEALRDAAGGNLLVATTLARRGITTPAAARAFLDANHYTPAPAIGLPDVDRAGGRIWRALRAGEQIAVWGDFDVDGQSATALLVEALRDLSSMGDVSHAAPVFYRVPERSWGHGIYLPALDELLKQGVTLLITGDTGVDALTAIERASGRGCDVIVTDHHDLPARLPNALAIVNPKGLSPDHPLYELPAVGVVYKLVEHLYQQAGLTDGPERALDLVALGIVADVASLVNDVRYLLQRGLEVLRRTDRVGLRTLIEQAELRPDGLSEEHIGYQLAPRLNALGRLGDANRGVELLLSQNVAQARMLAAEIDGLNYHRRLITNQVLQAALTQIEREPALLDSQALVVAGSNWHPGVLGLVAGRLVEQFRRPAVVLSISADNLARGSARSLPGCDIHAALKHTADCLLRFGGHPGAAGLTLDASNLETFRKALSRAMPMVWDSKAASPGLQIDAYVALDQLSLELVSQMERLAPFGHGNPPVQLATCDVQIVEEAIVGRDGEHRRLLVADEQGVQQTVLWWQGASQKLPESRFDLAYTLRARDYRGEVQLQVEWLDARPHKSATLLPTRSVRAIFDRREEVNPLVALAKSLQEDVTIWAEGASPSDLGEMGGVDRLHLTPSSVFAIWTAPPGQVELAQALQAVNPGKVYVFAVEPATARFRPFVKRLVGMVKHDLRARGGQVDVARLAAALGHREATVFAGLEWLVARGQVCLVKKDGSILTLQSGGEPSRDLHVVESRLRRLLDETAAYRRYFRSAPIEVLQL